MARRLATSSAALLRMPRAVSRFATGRPVAARAPSASSARDFSLSEPDDFVSTLPSDLLDDLLDELPMTTVGADVLAFPARHRSTAGTPLNTPAGQPATAVEQGLRFTGTGAEYFRLWVVNTLLTVLSLGLYGPWARRRQQRWFALHTFLDGEAFDFHGEPHRMLLGRVIVLGLLLGTPLAFLWSPWAGGAMLALLGLAGPALLAQARRFRLSHTSWRGVRFGFEAKAAEVYAASLPLTATCLVAALGVAGGLQPWVMAVVAFGAVMGAPLAHGWLQAFQHRHAVYGTVPFKVEMPAREFHGLYLSLVGLVALVAVGAGAASFALLTTLPLHGVDGPVASGLVAGAAALLTLALAWPAYGVRLRQLMWRHTRLSDGIAFRDDLETGKLSRVLLGHGLLVPLTLGLYWPFFVVRLARLRLEAMRVLSDEPLADVIVSAPASGAASTAGTAGLAGLVRSVAVPRDGAVNPVRSSLGGAV